MATNLSADEQSRFESRLISLRDELREQIAAEEDEVGQFSQSQADEFSSQHNADLATDVFLEEMAVSTKMTLESELEAVEQALERISEGSYGVCVQCGQPIPKDRLDARPQAIRCVADERLRETSGRQA
jgi:DnaK suppressor protein